MVAATTASAFSWTNIDQSSWITKASWYITLVFSFMSICVAALHSIALYRLNSYPDGLSKIRQTLGEEITTMTPSGHALTVFRPRLSQVYIWQVPVMLLNLSICLFLVGLTVFVWDLAFASGLQWESDNTKVLELCHRPRSHAAHYFQIAMTFTVAGGVAGINYVLSMFCLFYRTSKLKDS